MSLNVLGGTLNAQGQLMVIEQVSQRIHPEIHSWRIWGPQGPDSRFFGVLWRHELWLCIWFIAMTVMSTRARPIPLKCSAIMSKSAMMSKFGFFVKPARWPSFDLEDLMCPHSRILWLQEFYHWIVKSCSNVLISTTTLNNLLIKSYVSTKKFISFAIYKAMDY